MGILILLLCWGAEATPDWEPARWAPPAPGMETGPPAHEEPEGLVERLYTWYHNRVTPKDGARCPYYPTCSAFALEAWQERGPIIGPLLALDRLLREYPGMERFDHYPLITPHETPRLHDPVPPSR